MKYSDVEQAGDTLTGGAPPTSNRMFAALRHRDFRLLFTGLLISNIGGWMQLVALGWLVFDITGSSFYLGLVGLCRALPVFFFSLYGGTLADRLDRRRIMLWTQSSMGLMAVLLGGVAAANLRNVWLIILIAAVSQSMASFDAPVRQSLVPLLVPKADMSNAIGLNSAQFNAASVIGPSLAGTIISLAGPAVCFWLNALSFGCVVVALLRMKPLNREQQVSGDSVWRNFVGGIQYVAASPLVLSLLSLAAVPSLLARPFLQLMPVFALDVLHSGAVGLGFLTAASGVGAVGGGITAAQLGSFKRRGRVLLLGVTGFALSLLAFALSPIYGLSVGLLVIVGWLLALYMASVNTLLQTSVPANLRGRVISLYIVINMGFMPLGTMLLGTLAALPGLSVQIVLAAGCLITLVFILSIGLRFRTLRNL